MLIDEMFSSPSPRNQASHTRSFVGEVISGTPTQTAQVNTDRTKRTIEERSPENIQVSRSVRQRLNEFDMGAAFSIVEESMLKGVQDAINITPESLQACMKQGMETLMSSMRGMMSNISDAIQSERFAREAQEISLEDKLEKALGRISELEATADSLTRLRVKQRTKESIRDTEHKVEESMMALKLMEVDVGRATSDRREIVRKTLDEVRHYVPEEDLKTYDRVIRRTRVIILGKTTARWERDGEEAFSVPTLFQCRDGRDLEDLNTILRSAGYFLSFHWPKEMMEFVGGVREEMGKQGFKNDSHFVKIRPERRGGRIMVKAEVRPKTSTGRFVMKGLWHCPPLVRVFWDDVPHLFVSVLEATTQVAPGIGSG